VSLPSRSLPGTQEPNRQIATVLNPLNPNSEAISSHIAVVINVFRLPSFLKSDMGTHKNPKSLQKKTTAIFLFLLKKIQSFPERCADFKVFPADLKNIMLFSGCRGFRVI
jgi:hypothetical protein